MTIAVESPEVRANPFAPRPDAPQSLPFEPHPSSGGARAGRSVQDLARRGQEAVEQHPYRAVALATAAGLALGWLIARR